MRLPSFSDFALSKPTLDGVAAMGFVSPTAIQERVIPAVLEARDVVGCSQTGTGKTAAFLIPMIEGLHGLHKPAKFHPKALVLVPTRELAQQVAEHFRALAAETRLNCVVLHGGVDIGRQDLGLAEAPDVIVATPGRLLEHLDRGALKFRNLVYFVIDEADRLLDEGFLPDLRRIVDALPDRRQTMLFSATMPPEMDRLARSILNKPERVQVGLVAPREKIDDAFYPVPEHQKAALLQALLEKETGFEKVLVFVRTRAKAREIAPLLGQVTGLPTGELHAELTQAERNERMAAFREGTLRVLVATDVASRGLDIEAVSHVVNYDVPNTPDDYIHRVGRTARVERTGRAITLVAPAELALSVAIEEGVRRRIPTRRLEGFAYDMPDPSAAEQALRVTKKRRHAVRPFIDHAPKDGKKKKPFTKSGQLIPEYRDPQQEKPRRNAKKREQRRLLNKRLPHQKKKR